MNWVITISTDGNVKIGIIAAQHPTNKFRPWGYIKLFNKNPMFVL